MSAEKIGIIGLGYVGMPLASALAEHFDVVGFDIKAARVEELKSGKDHTGEVSAEELKNSRLSFTADIQGLSSCTFLIVAVPTPTTTSREPDLEPLEHSSKAVGSILKKGMMVSYESTVYPGVTEDVCLPILE